MRLVIKANYGEPDVVQSGGSGSYQYEIYVYARKDINRMYQFLKSAPVYIGCDGQWWYVSQIYPADYVGYNLYQPPIIAHDQVKSGEPGKNLLINVKVTDDDQVTNVILFYCKPGETLYQQIIINHESDTYSAEIPAEKVTTAGIQYYIEATDNDKHKSRLPLISFYLVTIK